ncbi:hypothetical protein ACFWNK_01960 [Streptomyces sp. NPDC058417]|uniref:zinc finger domain-containing protein n=1 Tax=unclassified Streptomyces TaxID=2593676 RepID=UPI0036595FD3
MNPEQVPELIAKIAMADPRVRREDPVERRGQLQMWIGILADVPYDFAVQAAQQHYATSQWPITAGDIATRWQTAVRDRMAAHTQAFEPYAHPDLDPDDADGYLAALRGERQAVAHGQLPPEPVRAAITAGPAAAEAQRRIAQLGDYLTTEARTALAPLRPRASERERLLRGGHGDYLAVACPHIHCLAPAGQPCRNRHRVARTTPHPSRVDHAAA